MICILKITRFIQGNNIAWTNLDMIRNIQHLHMNKNSYTYKTLLFNSHWIFLSNINHCKSLMANVCPSVKTRSNVDQSIVKQGQCIPSPKDLTWWPWQSIGFQIFLRTKYVPSLVKIHWNMLILQCSQGCYRVKIRPCDLENQ